MASVLKTFRVTVAATNAVTQLPPNCFAVVLRCPSSNAGITYISIDESPANSTYSTPIRAGESLNIDLGQAMQVIAQREGFISQEKFIRFISVIGTASDILTIDALQWV